VVTLQTSGDVWSYPNVHGDIVATANASGAKQGVTVSYDPFGQGAPPDDQPANLDYGWLGQSQRPTEHAGSVDTVEMGARPYVPAIGRFLTVDPVPGGSANAYDYVHGDPVNGFDPLGAAHRKGKRPSTKEKHQEGESRQKQDQQKTEKGDKRRKPQKTDEYVEPTSNCCIDIPATDIAGGRNIDQVPIIAPDCCIDRPSPDVIIPPITRPVSVPPDTIQT
jgi:RHS repeat-associated protein